jgi:NhaP-type Na+/H+ or K+/H+ antiporter
MSEYPIFIYAAVLILGFGIFSRLAEKSIVTPPMVFVLFGIIASFFRVDIVADGIYAPAVKIIAELTLILVLFIDASTINLKELMKERKLPIRLLFVGLPITMVAGILIAIPLFPGMNIWVIAMMALILSPTDAALGQAVVTSSLVPQKIRQTINVESGLNDGIALPPILICLAALSAHDAHGSGFAYWGAFVMKQFIFGPLVGSLVGFAGGLLVERAAKRDWMNTTFQRLTSISLAILAFYLAEMIHGNGFIAAYFAGLLLGTTTHSIRERIHEFGEAESQILQLFIFLLFGMILVPLSYQLWDWQVWVYAILSLTAIRILPVVISLAGTELTRGTKYFIGWFGPRGIASILYLLMVVIELGAKGLEKMMSVIVLTVLLSIYLHGISANPLSKLYQKNNM